MDVPPASHSGWPAAFVVQANERLLEFAANNLLILIIAQLALVFVIGLGIRRKIASAALRAVLRLCRLARRRWPHRYSPQTSVVVGVPVASAMFGAAAIYGHVTEAVAGPHGAACCSWP